MINTWKEHRKSMKTGLAMTLLGGIAGLGMPAFVHAAPSSEDISTEKEKVDKSLKEINENLEKNQKEISEQKENYSKIETKLESVNEGIAETEVRIEKRGDILKARAVNLQQQESPSLFLGFVLGANSFTDFVERMNAAKTIMDADQSLMEEQSNDQRELERDREVLKEQEKSLTELFQTLQQQETEWEAQKAEKEALSAQLNIQYAKTKSAEEKARREALEKSREAAELKTLLGQEFSVDVSEGELTSSKASDKGRAAISEASKYIGGKYVWGGANPKTSFDCSGLVQWSFKTGADISLPRTAAQQYLATERIQMSELKPGDLIFFSYGDGIAHVGIYVGNWEMLNAQNSGIKVTGLGWWEKYIAGFGRVSGT